MYGFGKWKIRSSDQDRAISVREAALLQTFPRSYAFFDNEDSISIGVASRYIGNAVPPRLGEVIAESIIQHIRNTPNER